MTRRELTAWLLVAFLAGSATIPKAGAVYYTGYSNALWAIRAALARNCEATATVCNGERTPSYDTRRCWR